jgi:hypothetical protein
MEETLGSVEVPWARMCALLWAVRRFAEGDILDIIALALGGHTVCLVQRRESDDIEPAARWLRTNLPLL